MSIEESFWIFGYGSLIWKPDFPYERRCLGYVKGYVRRFSQLSVTHRGTVELPGRCATLVPSDDPDARVWGYAYEIVDPASIECAKQELFDREVKAGDYCPIRVRFYLYTPANETSALQFEDANPRAMVTYIADPRSSLYSNDATINKQALDIATASGYCGPNTDYLFRLIKFMRTDVPSNLAEQDDPYIFKLGYLVQTFLKNKLKTNTDLLYQGS